jgi:hypothetical protein
MTAINWLASQLTWEARLTELRTADRRERRQSVLRRAA